MAPLVVAGGLLSLHIAPEPPGTPRIQLQCYLTALEIASDTESVDIGTYCAPAATDVGRTTYSAVAALLWEPALYDALQPHIGKLATAWFTPQTGPGSGTAITISFETRIGAQPWGRFELGSRVEVDWPLPVLSTPVLVPTGPPA